MSQSTEIKINKYVARFPAVVEAQIFVNYDDACRVAVWCNGTAGKDEIGTAYIQLPVVKDSPDNHPYWDRTAKVGDYIVKDSNGVLTIMSTDEFNATYLLQEPVVS